ncbi:tetratricopeptide repeat protein [Streptomyces sp. 2A115]|uniref:tetratricopeptide repeat protein n=1 Tax=Streptomyces sp. 2A115 TaxID=3457439 RepID=UPI003FD1E777
MSGSANNVYVCMRCAIAGRLTEAAPYLDQAITAWEETGYFRGTGLARIVLGEIALASGDPSLAVAHFDRAHTTLAAVPDPHDTARALAFLGRARACAGEYESGLAQLTSALRTFEHSGSVHWQARTLEMLGQTAQDGDHLDTARDYYQRSLALCTPISIEDARRLRERLDGLPTG